MFDVQRSEHDRLLLGVCGGFADRFAVHPGLIRGGFAIAALASGIGILLYLVVALLMLPPGETSLRAGERLRANLQIFPEALTALVHAAPSGWREWIAQRASIDEGVRLRAVIGGAAILLGLLVLSWSLGLFWWLTFWRAIALIFIVLGVAVLLGNRRFGT